MDRLQISGGPAGWVHTMGALIVWSTSPVSGILMRNTSRHLADFLRLLMLLMAFCDTTPPPLLLEPAFLLAELPVNGLLLALGAPGAATTPLLATAAVMPPAPPEWLMRASILVSSPVTAGATAAAAPAAELPLGPVPTGVPGPVLLDPVVEEAGDEPVDEAPPPAEQAIPGGVLELATAAAAAVAIVLNGCCCCCCCC